MGCTASSSPSHEQSPDGIPQASAKNDDSPASVSASSTSTPNTLVGNLPTFKSNNNKTRPPALNISPLSSSSNQTGGLTLERMGSASTNGSLPPTPLVNRSPRGKMTLLQARSQGSPRSSILSCGSQTGSVSLGSLDPNIIVVVPDNFRRKYKILSTLSEKSINCFGFHASDAGGKDGGSTSECTSEDGEDNESHADVTMYRATDRQMKYVIVERTRTKVFEHSTMQVEFFDRIDCLRWINHECVPCILDVFDTPQDYTIVFQYGVGKSLAELLTQRGCMSNPQAIRAVVLALVDALKHMHKQNIAHRHICAKELIVSRFNHFSRPRDLTVTGLSRVVRVPAPTAVETSLPTKEVSPRSRRKFEEKKSTSTTSGSTSRSAGDSFGDFVVATAAVPEQFLDAFCAPELSQSGHGLEVDLYSLGVVVYSLLAGFVPESKDEVRVEALSCASSLKRLITSLLRCDPLQRPSLRRVEKYFVRTYLHDNEEMERKSDELVLGDVEVAPVLLKDSIPSFVTPDKSMSSSISSALDSISSGALNASNEKEGSFRLEEGVLREDCLRILNLAEVTPPPQELHP